MDVFDGVLNLRAATTGFESIDNSGVGEPAIQTDVWHHVVVEKISGGTAALYFGDENGLTSLGTSTLNPGGLQYFRLGINRETTGLYGMEMANVQIHDVSSATLRTTLNNEGPMLIPEPSSALFLLGGLFGFALRRRR